MVCTELTKKKVREAIESKMLKMLQVAEWLYFNLLFEILKKGERCLHFSAFISHLEFQPAFKSQAKRKLKMCFSLLENSQGVLSLYSTSTSFASFKRALQA